MEELSRLLDAGWRLHAGGRVEGTSLEHSVQVTLVHGAKKANGVAATFEIALRASGAARVRELLAIEAARGGVRTVAALYIDPRGVYPTMPGIDCWDESRDARLYDGPSPVVAHPPCQLWVNYAALNYKRYGGEHNRPGNDGGCFAAALSAVRAFGGVLEHPASSNAWAHFELPRPIGIGWLRAACGWVCEVWQSAYGHKARKRTWLYYCGANTPAEADWSRGAGTHQCGWFDRIKPTLSKREASATPPLFAQWLVSLARAAE